MPTEDRGGLSGPTVLKFLRTTSLVAFKLWAPGPFKLVLCKDLLRSVQMALVKTRSVQKNILCDNSSCTTPVPLLSRVFHGVSTSIIWRLQLNVELLGLCVRFLLPGTFRTLQFYNLLFKLTCGYVKTAVWDIRTAKCISELKECWDSRHSKAANLTKRTLLKLSGFYLKVAQVFATKADLLPKEYVHALSCVLDDCAPMPVGEVKRVVERELGAPISKIFHRFDLQPIGSATIAQVHRAVLQDGRHVAVKVQNTRNKKLMRFDLRNMLFVSRLLDRLRVYLPFDHTSILVEYSTQVPLEFDFNRERRMLSVLGRRISSNHKVRVPAPIDGLCTAQVLTMTLIEGKPLATFTSVSSKKNVEGNLDYLRDNLRELLASFGFQILNLGVFHSDPHPGNILLRDFRDIALIDFGQVKILSDETRVLFAHLVVSLYEESDQLYAILKTLKVEFTINDPKLIRTIASILFDTRMDIPEALVSPLDSEFPAELRSVRINVIPTEVFMIIRIIAIFRGIFSALDIDLHARKLWVSSARQTILDSERVYNFNILATPRNEVNIVDQLKHFSAWLALHGLPHQREYMMAFAKLHVFCIKDLRKLAAENERSALDAVFANFSEQDRSRCLKLCYEDS